jgi:carotenoid cleavage dioxygenase-like enzyme
VDNLPGRGTLPPDMDGMFVRNGPNPQFPPLGPYHWFVGDGMVHGVRGHDGQASYRPLRSSRPESYATRK